MTEIKPKPVAAGYCVSYNEETKEFSVLKVRFEGRNCKSVTTVVSGLTRYDIKAMFEKQIKGLFNDFTVDKLY